MRHAALIALVVTALASGCRCMHPREHDAPGRYQATHTVHDGMLLLDTATGSSWIAEWGTEYKTLSWHPNPPPPASPK